MAEEADSTSKPAAVVHLAAWAACPVVNEEAKALPAGSRSKQIMAHLDFYIRPAPKAFAALLSFPFGSCLY